MSSNPNTKPPAAASGQSARALFRQSKQAAASSSSSTPTVARIHHPFAAYDTQGRLSCTLCDTRIKSVAGWKVHLASAEHKAAAAHVRRGAHASSTAATTAPAVKRTWHAHDGRAAKVAKTEAASRVAAAAAPLAAAYGSSSDEDDDGKHEQAPGTNDDESEDDDGGALPAGFFDDNGSESDPDVDAIEAAPSMDHGVNNNDDDAELLAYDVVPDHDTVPPTSANLAAVLLGTQLDDEGRDNDQPRGALRQPSAHDTPANDRGDEPDVALFAHLLAERAQDESRTQSELVERLRRLHTQLGQTVQSEADQPDNDDDDDESDSDHGQDALRNSAKGQASDEDDDDDDLEDDAWNWRTRGIPLGRRS